MAQIVSDLHSTRETELLNDGWKIHQVCAWIGNSEPVAMEHYLQVTEADFAKAAGTPEAESASQNISPDKAQQNAQQNLLQHLGIDRNESDQTSENPDDSQNRRDSHVVSAPRIGRIYELSRESAFS